MFITGYVQAVGYRMYVRRYADQLGITGFAQNLPDGRVKVVASGSETKIEELLEKLRQGPRLAVVRNVVMRWLDDYVPFSCFNVK